MNLARAAGAVYVLTIVSGMWALAGPSGSRMAANALAAASYVAVTVLFYFLFKPVHARVSLAAAVVGLTGCVMSGVAMSGLWRPPFNALGLFGVYCLLIGWLLVRSTLPRFLGVLMALGGVGWLTFFVPLLSRAVAPYNFVPGIVGETVLTVWLLVGGVLPRARPS